MLNSVLVRNALVAAVLMGSTALSGCNNDPATVAKGGAASGSPAAATTTRSTSGTLSLSGTSVATIRVGETYSFQPGVAGTTTRGIGFSIQNKPNWATFDTTSGALSGTPAAGNLGTYSNIVISASNNSDTAAALAAFSITVAQVDASTGSGSGSASASANASATLSWTPPTQNTDGSPILNLAGYRIYYGSSAGALTNSINVTNPGLTAYTVADLKTGTTYFGITAYTSGGTESGISNIGSKTVM
jgi:Fibronectin type III domain